jgi:hypothetical protein
VAAERAALDREVATLAWRRSALRAVEEAAPTDRAERLDLLSAVQDRFCAHDTLVRLWRPMTTGPIPPDTVRMFLDISAPRPPELPTPAQVVAYAELVLLASDRALATQLRASTLVNHDRIADLGALHATVGAACELAFPQVAAGTRPTPGPALDQFVAAHAAALGVGDTLEFRRALNRRTAADRHPRLRRYWHLVGEITGDPAPVGVTHTWLLDALDRSAMKAQGPGGPDPHRGAAVGVLRLSAPCAAGCCGPLARDGNSTTMSTAPSATQTAPAVSPPE